MSRIHVQGACQILGLGQRDLPSVPAALLCARRATMIDENSAQLSRGYREEMRTVVPFDRRVVANSFRYSSCTNAVA